MLGTTRVPVRALVLGGAGMLGHKVYQVLRQHIDTWTTVRSARERYDALGLFDPGRLIDHLDAGSIPQIEAVLDDVRPDVVINCVGIVKQLRAAHDAIASIETNALLPHQLELYCAERGIRLIHVSTDCVFSGRHGAYTEDDLPDPADLYGRSKLLGEVSGPASLTVRTSIIGREIGTAHGLVEWFLEQTGPSVLGYTHAIFSGFPTIVLSSIIDRIIREQPHLSGIYHVSADPISKYDLLLLLRDAYSKKIDIQPYSDVAIDRSLVSERFRRETGFTPESWPAMIEQMSADSTPYALWRQEPSVCR